MTPYAGLKPPVAPGPDAPDRLARDVARGLASDPPALPCMYFYDEAGSAIYDEITRLPEYYPPRAEAEILREYGGDMLDRIGPCELVELGAGPATRTRILLDEVARRSWPLVFLPTDASRAMLGSSIEALRREYPGGSFEGVLGDYEATLAQLLPRRDRTLVFLGGTIGNLEDDEIGSLAAAAARALEPGGHFLVGFDRQAHPGKRAQTIHAAYNDAAGVTARFNLNMLARLNRELGADFDLAAWEHEAPYNTRHHRIEMFLRSKRDQQVRIPALDRTFFFPAGLRILTEISRKFEPDRLVPLFQPFGLVADWSDAQERFGMALFRRT
ncbi:MAG: L-histidine N(alpha)-methyltransferase [Candidatus Sericytochromatia bacterium]|nr:L-histidine N(alpha)-methyltransferase [Candidatus Tanganyikabacteria bacterium]